MSTGVQATIREIREKFDVLRPLLDERLRRVWAASEARSLGTGGITIVSKATRLSRTTVSAGIRELEDGIAPEELPRLRRPGAGRKRLEDEHPDLLVALELLVDPLTRGDPESPLRWTAKSTRKLASELRDLGYKVSPQKVNTLLRKLGYSLQANRKTREGTSHPDRNAQFEHISRKTRDFLARGQPVISVDTKKKELVGDFKNNGREWNRMGEPEEVRVHDFKDDELGKAVPYGIYDIGANEGWVNVGVDHDTPEFAVESIRRWWSRMGKHTHPDATELLVMADAGGSNSYRSRAWKFYLQQFADETGLKIVVRHFPPGTSKWNKIEHRMWSYISMNWRGRPLVSLEVVISLISNTTTTTGLRVQADVDNAEYPTGKKIDDEAMGTLRLRPSTLRGKWNYAIWPS